MVRIAILLLALLVSPPGIGQTYPSGCPRILVTGPAGIVEPRDIMTFQASLTGEVPKDVTFSWEVTNGAIVGGQGTPELKASYTDRWASFMATVTVGGLPNGCPTRASEALHISGPHDVPEHLGAINNSTYTIDKPLLKRIRESLTANHSSQLYVWVYVGSSSEKKLQSLKSYLLRQLSATNIDPSRITIRVSSEKPRGSIFWRVPPGVENPSP